MKAAELAVVIPPYQARTVALCLVKTFHLYLKPLPSLKNKTLGPSQGVVISGSIPPNVGVIRNNSNNLADSAAALRMYSRNQMDDLYLTRFAVPSSGVISLERLAGGHVEAERLFDPIRSHQFSETNLQRGRSS